MAWQPIETAPKGKMLMVWGSGGAMLGYQDENGNWRQRHHGPHKAKPSHWMNLPRPPAKD